MNDLKFEGHEKEQLLEIKGVGPTVIQRFEEIGIASLEELAKYDADEIANRVADMLRTTCWKNSPQAKTAITSAIEPAQGKSS